jgi:hypothetical protein
MYANDPERLNTKKYRELVNLLENYVPKGELRRLTSRRIRDVCHNMLGGYYIKKCILLAQYKLSDIIFEDTISFLIIIPDDSDFSGEVAKRKLADVLHINVNIECISESDWKQKKDLYADKGMTMCLVNYLQNVHTATKKSLI